MRKSIHTFLALLVIISGMASTQAQRKSPTRKLSPKQTRPLSAREIASRAYSSTVVVHANDEDSNLLAEGTGFFITPNVVATNYHVIEGAASVEIELITKRNRGHVVNIIRYDEKSDLALLEVPQFAGKPIPLFRGKDLYVGDEIYVLGNPEGLDATFSKGNISAFREFDTVIHIQITAPISAGSSGGPVINDHGEVIGIAQSQLKRGQNLNFAIAVPHLLALMSGDKDIKVVPSYNK
jgi:S1-C subfamily serine protease